MPTIERVRTFLLETEKTGKKPLLVVLGPTASGKTAFSLKLALEVDGEIISTDSRQIYRYMDLGTDKISAQIRAKVPHHMIDIRDPDQPYSLADFQREAKKIIDDSKKNLHKDIESKKQKFDEEINKELEGWIYAKYVDKLE